MCDLQSRLDLAEQRLRRYCTGNLGDDKERDEEASWAVIRWGNSNISTLIDNGVSG